MNSALSTFHDAFVGHINSMLPYMTDYISGLINGFNEHMMSDDDHIFLYDVLKYIEGMSDISENYPLNLTAT